MGDNGTWNCCQKLLAIEVLPNCMCSNRINELKSTSRRRAMMHSKLADSCHLQYKVSNHASSVAKFHFSGSSASLFHSTATVRNYRQLIIVKFYKFDSSKKKSMHWPVHVDACLLMAFSSAYISDNPDAFAGQQLKLNPMNNHKIGIALTQFRYEFQLIIKLA